MTINERQINRDIVKGSLTESVARLMDYRDISPEEMAVILEEIIGNLNSSPKRPV